MFLDDVNLLVAKIQPKPSEGPLSFVKLWVCFAPTASFVQTHPNLPPAEPTKQKPGDENLLTLSDFWVIIK